MPTGYFGNLFRQKKPKLPFHCQNNRQNDIPRYYSHCRNKPQRQHGQCHNQEYVSSFICTPLQSFEFHREHWNIANKQERRSNNKCQYQEPSGSECRYPVACAGYQRCPEKSIGRCRQPHERRCLSFVYIKLGQP